MKRDEGEQQTGRCARAGPRENISHRSGLKQIPRERSHWSPLRPARGSARWKKTQSTTPLGPDHGTKITNIETLAFRLREATGINIGAC